MTALRFIPALLRRPALLGCGFLVTLVSIHAQGTAAAPGATAASKPGVHGNARVELCFACADGALPEKCIGRVKLRDKDIGVERSR